MFLDTAFKNVTPEIDFLKVEVGQNMFSRYGLKVTPEIDAAFYFDLAVRCNLLLLFSDSTNTNTETNTNTNTETNTKTNTETNINTNTNTETNTNKNTNTNTLTLLSGATCSCLFFTSDKIRIFQ